MTHWIGSKSKKALCNSHVVKMCSAEDSHVGNDHLRLTQGSQLMRQDSEIMYVGVL